MNFLIVKNAYLHEPHSKSKCLMVTPQIPSVYFANLEMHPFYGIFTSRYGFRAALYQKVT